MIDAVDPTAAFRALLEAGAPVRGIRYPTGYAAVDELLAARGE